MGKKLYKLHVHQVSAGFTRRYIRHPCFGMLLRSYSQSTTRRDHHGLATSSAVKACCDVEAKRTAD